MSGVGTQDKIFIKEIPEGPIQRNFRYLVDFFTSFNQERAQNNQLGGFEHFDLSFAAAGEYQIHHTLGVIPLDVVQTFLTGSGALTWNYAKFTKDTLDLTVTGPCRVRAYVGTQSGGEPL